MPQGTPNTPFPKFRPFFHSLIPRGMEFITPCSRGPCHYSQRTPKSMFYDILLFFLQKMNQREIISEIHPNLKPVYLIHFQIHKNFVPLTSIWFLIPKFEPYVSYLLLTMAHFRGANSPKILRGPRGIGSRFPVPKE